MKRLINLISLMVLLFSPSLFASPSQALIEDVFCGEMDPFVVGDVCVVFFEFPAKSKIAVIYDFDQMLDTLENPESLIGKQALVDVDLLAKIYSKDVLAVLQAYSDKYFYLESDSSSPELVE